MRVGGHRSRLGPELGSCFARHAALVSARQTSTSLHGPWRLIPV